MPAVRVAARPGPVCWPEPGCCICRAQAVAGLGSSAGLFEPLLLLDAVLDTALDAFAGKHGRGGGLGFFFGGAALDRVGDDEGGDKQGG